MECDHRTAYLDHAARSMRSGHLRQRGYRGADPRTRPRPRTSLGRRRKPSIPVHPGSARAGEHDAKRYRRSSTATNLTRLKPSQALRDPTPCPRVRISGPNALPVHNLHCYRPPAKRRSRLLPARPGAPPRSPCAVVREGTSGVGRPERRSRALVFCPIGGTPPGGCSVGGFGPGRAGCGVAGRNRCPRSSGAL